MIYAHCSICRTKWPTFHQASNCCSAHPNKQDTYKKEKEEYEEKKKEQARFDAEVAKIKLRERRERIAAQVLAGLVSNETVNLNILDASRIVPFCLEITDALLKELDR